LHWLAGPNKNKVEPIEVIFPREYNIANLYVLKSAPKIPPIDKIEKSIPRQKHVTNPYIRCLTVNEGHIESLVITLAAASEPNKLDSIIIIY
jgi:hypothetical protein